MERCVRRVVSTREAKVRWMLLAICLIAGQSAHGQLTPQVRFVQPPARSVVAGKAVVSSSRLTRSLDSEVDINGLSLLILEDGTRVIAGAGTASGNGDYRESWAIEVDPIAETYRASLVRDSESASFRSVRGQTGGGSEPIQLMSEDPPPNCGGPEPCSDRCRGNWNVDVRSMDLVLISLTKTVVQVGWWQAGAMTCNSKGNGYGSCWAANPTPQPLNTHWYVSTCTTLGGGPSGGSGTTTQVGNYYNYDFGDDSKITTVSSRATISYDSEGYVSWDWYYADSGESSGLIYSWFNTGGSINDC